MCHARRVAVALLSVALVTQICGGKDVFVHISALAPSGLTALNEGERVTFDVAEGRKGPEAVQVRLI